MPTYEYDCQNCGHDLEAFQRMSDEPLRDCPKCGEATLKRRIGLGAGIIFKGGGFYETDFKDRSGKAEKPAKDSKEAPSAEKKGESGSKPAAAKESSSSSPAGAD
jgi:putative FmdB family regulatory protein